MQASHPIRIGFHDKAQPYACIDAKTTASCRLNICISADSARSKSEPASMSVHYARPEWTCGIQLAMICLK